MPSAVTAARPRAAVILSEDSWREQFGPSQRSRLRTLADLTEPIWAPSLHDERMAPQLAGIDVLITSWGVGSLDGEILARMPRLRAVLHGAGSARAFVTEELWRRDIAVSTSAALNAEPVAEYTLAAIILGGKRAPFLAASQRDNPDRNATRTRRGRMSNAGLTVGVVGFSRIGRRVVQLVRQTLHEPRLLVHDPYVDPRDVAASGATLVTLPELLTRADVLTLHAPALPSTRHMIGAAELALLTDGALVINTARGALLDHPALEAECASGRLDAILDTTDPEPLPADSRLYRLPNVMATPHVAGAMGTEAQRLIDGALDELERFGAGEPLLRLLTRENFELSA